MILLPDAPCPCLHTQLTRIPALPDMVCTCTCTTAAVRHSVHHTGIRAEQPTARLAAGVPEPADLALAHLGACYGPALKATRPHLRLEALQRQLTLYRTLELSANNTDMCVAARRHAAPRSARDAARLPAHTGCALHAGAPLDARTVSADAPASDAELLTIAPGTLMRLTLRQGWNA